MARAKWIFGNQPQQPALPSKPPINVVSSADVKKFGFENFGNTCYANSVIQALYFCTPFRDLTLQFLDPSVNAQDAAQPPSPIPPVPRKLERKLSSAGQPVDFSSTNGSGPLIPFPIPSSPPTLFSALRSLFLHISSHPSDKGTVAPRAFIDKLKELNELFRSTMHQDAHEFLNYLLNKIVEEIEEERKQRQNGDDLSGSLATLASKTPSTSVSTSSNSGTPPEDATLVHKLFEGVLTSETRCLTCETVSSRDESFLDLSIDIEQNSSVTACLRQFSASEMLCQRNKFFCDSCCDLQEAEKRMKIKKLPNVLALHLKRFKYQEDVQKYIKLAYRVAFPFELRLFNTVDDMDNADRLYNLFGIVVHIGNGPHHGHYISIVKTLGTWLVFDDNNVYPIAESDITKYFGDSTSGSAYVLYYQAADIDLASLGLRTPPPPERADLHLPADMPFTGSPTQQAMPHLPPGLAEEGDSSDLSDPPFPITPSSISPIQTFSDYKEKLPKPPLEIKVSDLDGPMNQLSSPTTTMATPITSTPSTESSGRVNKPKIFGMRRTPSVSAKTNASSTSGGSGPEGRRSIVDQPLSASVLAASDDDYILDSLPVLTQPSGSKPVNGTDRDSDNEKDKVRKTPEKKSSMWFPKRKSLRVSARPESHLADIPPSPSPAATNHSGSYHNNNIVDSSGQTTSSSSALSSSSQWFRTSAYSSKEKDKHDRRPSFAEEAKPRQQISSPTRPKTSTGIGSRNRSDHTQWINRLDPVTSSPSASPTKSAIPPPPLPPPEMATVSQSPSSTSFTFPATRQTSLQPVSPSNHQHPPPPPPPQPQPQPQSPSRASHKKSLSNLSGFKPTRSATARPSTAHGSTRQSLIADISIPPVPPVLIQAKGPSHDRRMSSDYVSNKGKTRSEDAERDDDISDLSTPSYVATNGRPTTSSGLLQSTTNSASSNLQRAKRKLSLTGPMLGFGKKDKDKVRDREKDKVPSAFGHFTRF